MRKNYKVIYLSLGVPTPCLPSKWVFKCFFITNATLPNKQKTQEDYLFILFFFFKCSIFLFWACTWACFIKGGLLKTPTRLWFKSRSPFCNDRFSSDCTRLFLLWVKNHNHTSLVKQQKTCFCFPLQIRTSQTIYW